MEYNWHKTNVAFHKRNLISTVKRCGGSMMLLQDQDNLQNLRNYEFCSLPENREGERLTINFYPEGYAAESDLKHLTCHQHGQWR